MRVVIQRVSKAKVTIEKMEERIISTGIMVLVGIEESDTKNDVDWLTKKISNLRIFDDNNGVMNLSINEINGEAMIISQFTLHAKTKKGNRPSYTQAANPNYAIPLYNHFVEEMMNQIKAKVVTGEFGAHMDVEIVNDGPVTIIIDTQNKE